MLHSLVLTNFILLGQVVTDATPDTALGGVYFGLWCALVAAVTAAGAALTWYLMTRAGSSKVFAVLGTFWELAQNVVAHVEVHLRPDIQKALADGKLDAAEKAALKAKAIQLLKESAGPEALETAKKVLRLTVPGLEVFLSGLIERALGVQRASGTLPPPSPEAAAVRAAMVAARAPTSVP